MATKTKAGIAGKSKVAPPAPPAPIKSTGTATQEAAKVTPITPVSPGPSALDAAAEDMVRRFGCGTSIDAIWDASKRLFQGGKAVS